MQLRIMSFNLRYDKPDPGDNAWEVRRDAVAQMIRHYAPDAIGTQEALGHQRDDLLRLLPDYQSVGRDRTGEGSGESCAIFYRHQRLQCLQAGDFFLSDTPEIPGSISASWGNFLPRMASWAVFAVEQQTKIAVFNAHLDHQSARARELAAKLIGDRISDVNSAESLCFLTGDFNANPDTRERQTFLHPLSNGIQLIDAIATLNRRHQMTFHDFRGQGFASIDTIYYDNRLRLQQIFVDTAKWQGVWPSDHFAAIANFAVTITPFPV